jgi:hypothetical protein
MIELPVKRDVLSAGKGTFFAPKMIMAEVIGSAVQFYHVGISRRR